MAKKNLQLNHHSKIIDNFARNVNYTHAIAFHLRRAVMADVEVLVSGGGTVGHSAAQLVGPVPHNLREKQEEGNKTIESCGAGLCRCADFTFLTASQSGDRDAPV